MPLIEAQPDAVALTYASALYSLVSKQGKAAGSQEGAVEQTLGELEGVMEIARKDKNFNEFLASRIIPAEQRSASIEKMFKGKLSDTTVNFLRVLNDKGRLFALPGVVQAFDSLAQKAFGRVEVDVTTATPMSESDKAALSERLKAKLGRQPVLHTYVDESLLGGVRIQIGDHLIDASLATRLAQVRTQMAGGGAARVRAAAERLFTADPRSNGH